MVEEVLPEAYSRMKSNLLNHARDGTVVDMQSVFLDFTSFVMGHMAYDVRLYFGGNKSQLLTISDGP